MKRYSWLYAVFRVLIGVLFFMHGAQKLFGWFGGQGPVPIISLFGAAGIIETVGGLLILLGIYVRWVAVITAIEMLVALFTVHFPQGWNPLMNNGEPALLFFASFLVLIVHGSGIYNVVRLFHGAK